MRVARDAPCTVILVKQALPFEQLAQPQVVIDDQNLGSVLVHGRQS